MRKLIDGIERREVDRDGPRHHHPIISRDIMGNIGKIEPDAIPRLNTKRNQSASEPPRAFIAISIAVSAAIKVEEEPLAILLSDSLKHVRQGHWRKVLRPLRGMV